MEIKCILCPVDFSGSSDLALDLASNLARENNAKLYIVHVEDNPAVVSPGLFAGRVPANWRENHELAKTLPTVTEVLFEHDLLIGKPSQEIVDFAERQDVDLIVMGSHGHTGLVRLLMGSVAEAVVRHASVPVLTLNTDAKVISETPA